MSKKIFRFKIILNDIIPQIWRVVEVNSDITFYQFHLIIQEAMGWTNAHLHEFNSDGLRIGNTSEEANGSSEPPAWEERERGLNKFFSETRTKMIYSYDFGDSWEHTILLEAIEEKRKNEKYSRCIDGARACPPEDCGGTPGYCQLLEILANPKHKEHKGMKTWAGDYKPEYFNKDKATEKMRNALAGSLIRATPEKTIMRKKSVILRNKKRLRLGSFPSCRQRMFCKKVGL